jgi:2-dehydropantoate 2-reductase
MNIVIIGQGAIGLLWYHHIQQVITSSSEQSKAKLHLLASKSLVANKHNLQLSQYIFTDHNNQRYQGKINFAQTEDIQAADIVILCVKSFQIVASLIGIAEKLKPNASIVLAHNGMGTLSELPKSIIDKHNVYALLMTHGSLRTAPLTITHTGIGSTDIGLLSGVSDLAEQLVMIQLLNTALPTVTFHKDIKQKQWLKLAVNCVINPLTAINDIDNGRVNKEEYRQSITALLEEIIAVASVEGITLKLNELKQTIKKVAQDTAKNSSSMRCDVLAKRQTEIEYINGFIHRLGTKHDIATPENTKMWQRVKSLTQ